MSSAYGHNDDGNMPVYEVHTQRRNSLVAGEVRRDRFKQNKRQGTGRETTSRPMDNLSSKKRGGGAGDRTFESLDGMFAFSPAAGGGGKTGRRGERRRQEHHKRNQLESSFSDISNLDTSNRRRSRHYDDEDDSYYHDDHEKRGRRGVISATPTPVKTAHEAFYAPVTPISAPSSITKGNNLNFTPSPIVSDLPNRKHTNTHTGSHYYPSNHRNPEHIERRRGGEASYDSSRQRFRNNDYNPSSRYENNYRNNDRYSTSYSHGHNNNNRRHDRDMLSKTNNDRDYNNNYDNRNNKNYYRKEDEERRVGRRKHNENEFYTNDSLKMSNENQDNNISMNNDDYAGGVGEMNDDSDNLFDMQPMSPPINDNEEGVDDDDRGNVKTVTNKKNSKKKKGSKKRKDKVDEEEDEKPVAKKTAGRPPGAKNKKNINNPTKKISNKKLSKKVKQVIKQSKKKQQQRKKKEKEEEYESEEEEKRQKPKSSEPKLSKWVYEPITPYNRNTNERRKKYANRTGGLIEEAKDSGLLNEFQHGEEETEGRRRSTRMRFKPMDAWRNERLLYKRRSSGIGAFMPTIDIQHPVSTPTAFDDVFAKKRDGRERRKTQSKRSKKNGKKEKKKVVSKLKYKDDEENNIQSSSSEEEEEHEERVPLEPTCKVIDPIHNKPVLAVVAKSQSMVDMEPLGLPPAQEDEGGEGKVDNRIAPMGGKMFEESGFSSGILKIPPLGIKSYEITAQAEIFYISEAETNMLEVKVHKTTFNLSKGDSFTVPPENLYHLKNKSETKDAVIYFVLVKGLPAGVPSSSSSNIAEEGDEQQVDNNSASANTVDEE